MIRAFIAIDVPEEVKQVLSQIQEELKQTRAAVRWVKTDSIHLTLKFLGNIDPSRIEPIAAAAAEAVKNEPPLTLELGGLGAFPNLRNPRVVWIGIRGEVERLCRIQARLEQGLEALGFPREERPFRPHLTLGRVKDKRRSCALMESLTALPVPEGNSFDAKEIILYKSDLRPTGAIYTKLHRMPFEPVSP